MSTCEYMRATIILEHRKWQCQLKMRNYKKKKKKKKKKPEDEDISSIRFLLISEYQIIFIIFYTFKKT